MLEQNIQPQRYESHILTREKEIEELNKKIKVCKKEIKQKKVEKNKSLRKLKINWLNHYRHQKVNNYAYNSMP